MLFMGNWHQAVPALVIQDPVLEPVDKLVWMVIMLHARETRADGVPRLRHHRCKTNVASTSTVSRAIAILRLTRWLTLCCESPADRWRLHRLNVYSLRWNLAAGRCLFLDEGLHGVRHQAQNHHHARVQRVTQNRTGKFWTRLFRRAIWVDRNRSSKRRLQAAASQGPGQNSSNQTKDGRYFTFSCHQPRPTEKPVDKGG